MADLPEGTGLALRRARDFCGVNRSMCVFIDGRPMGTVAYGGRELFPLPPGVYDVQVAMDWCRSEPRVVRIGVGETIELEGGLRWRGFAWRWSLFSIFVFPGWTFVVRDVNEGRPATARRAACEGVAAAAGWGLTMYLALRLAMWLVA